MEGIEAIALKPSLRREISVTKATQQALFDDFWCLNGVGNGVTGEDFSVDDLLDLSNKELEDALNHNEEEEEEEEKDSVSDSSSQDLENSNSSAGEFETFPAVPVEDWKDLEWVSQFVDDSALEFPMIYQAGPIKTWTGSETRPEPAVHESPCFLPATKIPCKPRSKRLRTAKTTPWLSATSLILEAKKQKKKKKKRVVAGAKATVESSGLQRRCSHCQVQKTPQWRTGPMGAKTLCNACGVRFKSGRLFPEYRPACSPTFSVEVHSNSHMKVLEMRRKKEAAPEVVGSGLTQVVQSC